MRPRVSRQPVRRLAVRALLVGVLMFPVLSGASVLIPTQPALAASGSFEVLVDADSNLSTPAVREFAGASRYETSVAAARRYVETARVAGTPATTVIVASGEGLVDAAAAAGLARAVNAPVLLTPPGELFAPAAELIENAGITKAIVVGGEAVVSAQVVAALRDVPGVSSVERLGGVNRFDTAALIAQRAGLKNPYCNSGARAAVLVAGDSETLADVTVVGPLAYAMGLPVLLTSTQGVPSETAAAFDSLGIEHVVIAGGPHSIASLGALADELRAVGVVKVTRLYGSDQFAVSVRVLKALDLCLGTEFSDSSVALISDTALPDGISAAPMLGQGLNGDGKTTPALLVRSKTFPEAAQDHLIDAESSVKVFTIGGEGAVSREVAKAAVFAANGERYEAIVNLDTYVSSEYDSCRLLHGYGPYSGVTAGFPLSRWFPSSEGLLRVAVLFIDFSDAPARHTTTEETANNLALVEAYYERNSYGQLDIEFDVYDGWLRTSKSYRSYLGTNLIGADATYGVASEVLELADLKFDYSFDDYSVTMIVAPSTYFDGGGGGTTVFINSFPLSEVRDEPYAWWSVAAHELGHSLGLADLYPYDFTLFEFPAIDSSSGKRWAQIQIGRMGLWGIFPADTDDARFRVRTEGSNGASAYYPISFVTPQEMLSWSRWQLGWLREDQVACVTEPTFDESFTLSPIAAPDGTAMVVVPISSSVGIVIETRRYLGYDASELAGIPSEGIVIYEVDAPVGSGQLPLKFWPVVSELNPLRLDSFPVLGPGSSVTGILADGTILRVTVRSEDRLSYIVSVSRSQ